MFEFPQLDLSEKAKDRQHLQLRKNPTTIGWAPLTIGEVCADLPSPNQFWVIRPLPSSHRPHTGHMRRGGNLGSLHFVTTSTMHFKTCKLAETVIELHVVARVAMQKSKDWYVRARATSTILVIEADSALVAHLVGTAMSYSVLFGMVVLLGRSWGFYLCVDVIWVLAAR
eukprot:3415059-Amphidinium_carterae.1